MIVTLDTNIVINGCDPSNLDHKTVLLLVRSRSHELGLDAEQQIFTEYHRSCSRDEFFRKWWGEMAGRVHYVSGRLESAHARKLCALGCHEPSDHVFVAVARRTDRYLVTEDSDMAKGNVQRAFKKTGVATYLKSVLGLTVHDAVEAQNYLSGATS